MRTPRQSRSLPLPALAALVMAAIAGGASPAGAQVILGLPDDEPAVAAKQPASVDLQSGMTEIRKLVLDAHSLITHRRFPPEQARRLAAQLKQRATMLQAGTSGPLLTEVLMPLAAAADQIDVPASGDSQLDALDKIETALARYPHLIDDPTWKPLR